MLCCLESLFSLLFISCTDKFSSSFSLHKKILNDWLHNFFGLMYSNSFFVFVFFQSLSFLALRLSSFSWKQGLRPGAPNLNMNAPSTSIGLLRKIYCFFLASPSNRWQNTILICCVHTFVIGFKLACLHLSLL